MLPFFLCLYRYRYTRQTKGFGCYSVPPHLSQSRNSGALSLLAAFPCFWSSSYGRSRWLLIGSNHTPVGLAHDTTQAVLPKGCRSVSDHRMSNLSWSLSSLLPA
ncbi:hypothetical protein DV515_00011233, partial [Chloebia gouldiae]